MPPTPFDPCKQWLGIDAVDLVDPRRVLGIRPAETDATTVSRAAAARLDRLRSVEPGPFAVAHNALVKRVEEARDAVLAEIAAPARASHGSSDRLSMPPPPGGGTSPPRPGPSPVPRVPPVPTVPRPAPAASATPWPALDDADPTHAPAIEIRRPVVYRKKSSGSGVLLVLIAGLAAAAGGLYWYKFRPPQAAAKRVQADVALVDQHRPEPPPVVAATPPPAEPRKRKPAPEPEPEPEPAAVPEPEPEPEPKPRPKPEPPMVAEDPQKIEALLSRVAETLRAADFSAAADSAKAAATAAQAKPSRERVERWTELVTFAQGFADYRNQALATVAPGVEFDIDGKKIIVVEIDDEKFIYRYAGKNKTTPRNRIPGGILMAIVTGWFDENPANDLFIGAYHATKEEPDFDKARECWEKAAAGGADASLLLPLLDDPLLAGPESPE